jgi:hypothetical protein
VIFAARHPDPDPETTRLWLALVAGLCLTAAVALISGCSPQPGTLGDSPAITADLACDGALAVVQSRPGFRPPPAPAPAPPGPVPPVPKPTPPGPAPTQPCGNCGGTGKLGDTRVVYDCPICKGTGRVPAAAAPPCISGTCPPPPPPPKGATR